MLFYVLLALFCQHSLAQDSPIRVRLFPDLTLPHSAPVMSPDGNLLLFRVYGHPANAGTETTADLWQAERFGNWEPSAFRYPLGGEINTPEDETPVSLSAQADRLLVRHLGNTTPEWDAYRFEGRLWVGDSGGPGLPTFPEPILTLSLDPLSKICLGVTGNPAKPTVYLSLLDETLTWTKPRLLKGWESLADIRDITFSPDGNAVYISAIGSDKYAGLDLFFSRRLGPDWLTWTDPLRLPVGINTREDEYSPAPAPDGFTLLFTGQDAAGRDCIYRTHLPDFFRTEPPAQISLGAFLFPNRPLPQAKAFAYHFFRDSGKLEQINRLPFALGRNTVVPVADFLLWTLQSQDLFVPSILIPGRKGFDPYLPRTLQAVSPRAPGAELARQEKLYATANENIARLNAEIISLMSDLEDKKEEVLDTLSRVPQLNLGPLEKEWQVLRNTYNTRFRTTDLQRQAVLSFSEGASRIQFWRNDYGSLELYKPEAISVAGFDVFSEEVIRYLWLTRASEVLYETERELVGKGFQLARQRVSPGEIRLMDARQAEYLQNTSLSNFREVAANQLPEPPWPASAPGQQGFFDEMSIRVRPLLEKEIKRKVQTLVEDMAGQRFYLEFLREKRQRLALDRDAVLSKMEGMDDRYKQSIQLLGGGLPPEIQGLSQGEEFIPLRWMAYPLDYPEWIPLGVPVFPAESVLPDAAGQFELQRIIAILNEYPGIGIELAIQRQASTRGYRADRELSEQRKGYLDALLEGEGIGADRRRTTVNSEYNPPGEKLFPSVLLLRFFYRS